jgi:hypothetical protein
LEGYVFDLKANFDSARSPDKQPEMLNRFFDGLVHPMIHAGYGFEFGLPGMVVEGTHIWKVDTGVDDPHLENLTGLASTAVHQAGSSAVITRSLFESSPVPVVETLTSRLSSALNEASKGNVEPSANVHAFSILARILKDSRFDGKERDDNFQMYSNVMNTHGEALKKHASEWTVDTSDPREVERKIEELVWATVVIYGIPGWTEGATFNADFFQCVTLLLLRFIQHTTDSLQLYSMHLVTSSLFLSSIAAELKPSSQELLLRGYFVVILGWWVGRGRPGFDIPAFFAADTAYPTPPGPLPTPSEKVLPSQSSPIAITPNPWLPILQTAIVHRDDHLPKLQRSLAHYGSLYGLRAPGQADFSNTELPDAEKLDGTLFLRVAGLTAKRMGRVREGEEPSAHFWDRQGFYKE